MFLCTGREVSDQTAQMPEGMFFSHCISYHVVVIGKREFKAALFVNFSAMLRWCLYVMVVTDVLFIVQPHCSITSH